VMGGGVAAGSLSVELDPPTTRTVLDPLACRATMVPEPMVIDEPGISVWPVMIYPKTELADMTELSIVMCGGVIAGWGVTAFEVAPRAEAGIVPPGL